ncbi:nascent polypeptide-associated complex protein [Halobellus captivus]|uniref:nascent polypeptide-associated complex protein n=1 Tax=Halobellus captivus TaxID=2592614 RepID=UPI00119DADB5|nr:nascent polypeptide-associated complex protein [Halobellus captivus]
MFGGGGMNPRKMKQMMEQMGIDVTELDVEKVVITTSEEELVFSDAQVTRMDAQGQQTYQVVGEPESREKGAIEPAGGDGDESSDAADTDDDNGAAIPDEDVNLVAERAGVDADTAREALEATDGDLAAAIARLE